LPRHDRSDRNGWDCEGFADNGALETRDAYSESRCPSSKINE
jgi:hypothetical protein